MIRQSDSIHLLGTRAAPRIVMAPKRIYKKLKTVISKNRKYQFENFRESWAFLQLMSDEY